MIELQAVEKHYLSVTNETITALNPVSLSITEGEIFGVIGKSGAGKSTLLRCVNLLEPPSSGKVFVAGVELTQLPANELKHARQHIGMIFQHFNLLGSKTVYDNIALPLVLAGKSKTAISKAVEPLLELTELRDKKDQYPSQLSGGQKQRVAIARALANEPKVLLCDEATSALDPQTTQTILRLLKNINQQLKLTILLITHEMDVVKQICHRVALLDQGNIIETATIGKFFTEPKSALAKELIHSTLRDELPNAIKQRISTEKTADSNPVLRIYFYAKTTAEPLIAHLIKNIGIDINILQANIEFIQEQSLGVMTIEVLAHDAQFQATLDYLHSKNVKTEVLGYV